MLALDMGTRREWLGRSAMYFALVALPGWLRAATPACDDDEPTPRAGEGPFFAPRSPERSLLREPGTAGTPLRVEGRVTDRRCRPLARVLVDAWQCDGNGDYDNAGFRLRGHQYTDADGRFAFDTVRPAPYGRGSFRRTPHVHLKLKGEGAPLLTTQLYFPDAAENADDGMFDERLLVALSPDGALARYAFVLAIS